MAKSTVLYIANTALVGCGQMPIPTAAVFAGGLGTVPGGSLDKYQQKAVTFLNLLQKQLGMTLNKPFNFKRFKFTCTPGVALYTINNCTIEGFRANSFFNVTIGGPAGRLRVMSQEIYNESYAQPNSVPTGAPEWIVPQEDDGEEHARVVLVPTPDQTYVIEGQARVNVPDLIDGNSPCLFPKRYEHALIFQLITLIEWSLNEGRDASIGSVAQTFMDEVRRDSGGALEEPDQTDLGFSLWGNRRRYTRDYNPATDQAGPFP